MSPAIPLDWRAAGRREVPTGSAGRGISPVRQMMVQPARRELNPPPSVQIQLAFQICPPHVGFNQQYPLILLSERRRTVQSGRGLPLSRQSAGDEEDITRASPTRLQNRSSHDPVCFSDLGLRLGQNHRLARGGH